MSAEKVKDGYKIPNSHSIVRFLKTHLYFDGMMVSVDFWKLKSNEEYLSCMWYEYRNKDTGKIKNDIKKLLKGRLEGGYLPIQCIEDIQGIAKKHGLMGVHARFQGNKTKTAHAGLYNTSNDNLFLSEMAMETSRIIKQQQVKI